MAKTLIEQTEAATAKAQRAAEDASAKVRSEYSRLLLRNASPQAGDRQDLARCLKTLDKTTADMAADVALVERYQSMRARALRVGELQEARGEAVRRAKTTEEKTKAEISAIEDSVRAAKAAMKAAENRWHRARQADADLPVVRADMQRRQLDPAALEQAIENLTERSAGQ